MGLQIFAKLISAPVRGGMSDWATSEQILKYDITDMAEDYTNSIVFVNFDFSSRLMFSHPIFIYYEY